NDHALHAASITFDTTRDAADVLFVIMIIIDAVYFIDHAKCHSSINQFPSGQKYLHFGLKLDLQSYLSDLILFLAPESKTFFILVDNRPWLEDLVSKPAHLWQLMVTKSRFSPFAITRGQKDNKEKPAFSELNNRSRDSSKSRKLKRWLSMVTLTRKRVLLPVEKLRTSLLANSKLHRTLYGFVVFEVAWDDVRGIGLFCILSVSLSIEFTSLHCIELPDVVLISKPTYTSLAIESKYMKRWEFDSIAQAAKGLMSWFPGTPYEALLLEHRLNSMIGEAFHEAGTESPSTCGSSDDEKILNDGVLLEDVSPCNRSSSPNDQIETLEVQDQSSLPNTPPSIANTPPSIANTPPSIASTPPSITNTPPSHTTTNQIIPLDMNELDNECGSNVSYSGNASYHIPSPCPSECMEETEVTQYTDVLLLFRFNDRDLPFELQKIVMSDLRLLTLLEAGLPSWVLFFQSYPVFCHMYRPWMCPLARALYVAMSFVTVVIGFYDLYKNVPVLKAAASRLFGPLFDWIETWDMVSRIKYLGTMLFLHNAERAIMWFLMMTRTFRSLFSVLTQPLVAPFLVVVDVVFPFWNVFIQKGERLYSFICILLGTSWNLVDRVIDVLLLPVWYIASAICNFGNLLF
ncbi:hypothetical protein Tco_1366476, partial [Tanacetum coccineum]